MKKQLSFLPKQKTEHGGVHALGKRRARRPLNTKQPVHIVLRSDLAKNSRSLLKHKQLIERILARYSKRFRIRVYEKAICGNHIHCLVKAQTRRELQYFFRVFAGQVAQEILNLHPLEKHEKKAFTGGTPANWKKGDANARKGAERTAHPKNQRTFWTLLLYSRVVSWGRDYLAAKEYVIMNIKEVLGLIPYTERKRKSVPMYSG